MADITTISLSSETKNRLLKFKGYLIQGTVGNVNFDMVIDFLLNKAEK